MALDAALFTLHFVRRDQHPWIVDLYHANQLASSPLPVPEKQKEPQDSRPKPFSGMIPDRPSQKYSDGLDYHNLTPLYSRQRATHSAKYSTILLDGLLSDCLLASITEPSTSVKTKQIQLHNPDSTVTFEKKSNTFHQDWRFTFANEIFQWRKESSTGFKSSSGFTCQVVRKPDPNVLAAQYKPSTKSRPAMMQIMDYNLDRLGTEDKKGLEIALIMTLSALIDHEYDDRIAQSAEPNVYLSKAETSNVSSSFRNHAPNPSLGPPSQSTQRISPPVQPAPPPAPPIETTTDLEPNEVLISAWGTVNDYVDHCIHLLRIDSVPGRLEGKGMYLIVIRSDTVETTRKAVQVAAAVKSAYYRLPDEAKGTVYGRSSKQPIEEELYQYLQTNEDEPNQPITSNPSSSPKRRIIKLDPPSSLSVSGSKPVPFATISNPKQQPYVPPSRLRILLSKERIGELEPGPSKQSHTTSHSSTMLQPNLPDRPHNPSSNSTRPSSNHPQLTDSGKDAKGKAGFLGRLGIN